MLPLLKNNSTNFLRSKTLISSCCKIHTPGFDRERKGYKSQAFHIKLKIKSHVVPRLHLPFQFLPLQVLFQFFEESVSRLYSLLKSKLRLWAVEFPSEYNLQYLGTLNSKDEVPHLMTRFNPIRRQRDK